MIPFYLYIGKGRRSFAGVWEFFLIDCIFHDVPNTEKLDIFSVKQTEPKLSNLSSFLVSSPPPLATCTPTISKF